MAEYQYLPRAELQRLVDLLRANGFRCVGPQVRDGAIVFDTFESVTQLPNGVHDKQAPGSYHLERGDSPRLFAWANGPQALKPLTFVPRETLWRSERTETGLQLTAAATAGEPIAVFGVRSCDLAALQIHDQHFRGNDPAYAARRERLFLVAVNCSHPADTCFCVSTGDGPTAESGYDIRLDELDGGYLMHTATPVGGRVVQELFVAAANPTQLEEARRQRTAAVNAQSRRLPGTSLRDALFANLDHSRWLDVAKRCLSCGNCTSVCPTCFCHSEADEPALDGAGSSHYRQWDSCFTEGHSYIHGIVIRSDTRLRYRQWLTHKLGSWHEQFGRSGCVGCGRCISWCPAAIDITEEATAICGSAPLGAK